MPSQVRPEYETPRYQPNYRPQARTQRTTPARNYNDIWERRELRQQQLEQQRIEAQRLAEQRSKFLQEAEDRRLAAQNRVQVNPKTLLEPYITRQQILAEARRKLTTNFWGQPTKTQVDIPPEMWGYTPQTVFSYAPNIPQAGSGSTTTYRSVNPASSFWTNMLSNRRFAGPARNSLQMGQMYPFKNQMWADQSIAQMGLTPRYSSLNAPYLDPWAHDPYEPGGSPYATGSYEPTGDGGDSSWGGGGYGGWGGGGGSYSSSPGIYGESIRRNQWYSTLLQWNIT